MDCADGEQWQSERLISAFYTAEVHLKVTLTRAEAQALARFLAGAPPRRTPLGDAWGVIADALADKGIA